MEIIACIAAHPDDIELGMGGTISKFISQNKVIHCIVCFPMNDERKKESIVALEHLGVDSKNMYYIENHSNCRQLVEKLDKLIALINPDTIFTHFHGDTHQDHNMVNQCVLSCARENKKNVFLWENTIPGGIGHIKFTPDLFILLGNDDIDKKVESFQLHRSQFIKYKGISEFIRNKAKYWGYYIKEANCEVFQVVKLIIS